MLFLLLLKGRNLFDGIWDEKTENGVEICGFGGLLTTGSSEDIAENASKIREIIKKSREKRRGK